MSDRRFYVYVYFRLDGSPCYVGKGSGSRWLDHPRKKRHRNAWFGRLLAEAAELGRELPRVKIREDLTEAEAHDAEIALIAAIGRKSAGGPLTNLTDGGDGFSGLVFSAEHRAKLAAAKIGRKHSAETKARISQSTKGLPRGPMSEGHKKSISRAKSGVCSPKQRSHIERLNKEVKPHLGHKHSPETRAKISQATRKSFKEGRWRTYRASEDTGV